MPSKDQNRRRHARVKSSFIVTYTLPQPVRITLGIHDQHHTAVAQDISEGGIGVVVNEPLEAGLSLTVRFSLLNDDPISGREMRHWFDLKGLLMYCTEVPKAGYRAGILFKGVAEEDRGFLSEFIHSHSLKEKPL